MNPRQAQVLAELGVLRYRLRAPALIEPVLVDPVLVEPALVEPVLVEPASTAVTTEAPAPAVAAAALLTVYAPDAGARAPTGTGTAAAVWRQVLAWLRLDDAEVEWAMTPDAAALRLPACGEWSTAQGKRALWLALKPFVAGRLH